jgi:hypothetical protein
MKLEGDLFALVTVARKKPLPGEADRRTTGAPATPH